MFLRKRDYGSERAPQSMRGRRHEARTLTGVHWGRETASFKLSVRTAFQAQWKSFTPEKIQ